MQIVMKIQMIHEKSQFLVRDVYMCMLSILLFSHAHTIVHNLVENSKPRRGLLTSEKERYRFGKNIATA